MSKEIEAKDFLGNTLKVGDKCVHSSRSGGFLRMQLVEIKEFREEEPYKAGTIYIKAKEKSKGGWTDGDRLVKVSSWSGGDWLEEEGEHAGREALALGLGVREGGRWKGQE